MERNKNVVVNNGCYTREIGGLQGARIFHIPSRCSDLKKENALCYSNEEAGDPRQKPSGMTANFTTIHGFTLIELLVVVLIIGILAAVALPQYQKAVLKSRYTQAKTMGVALFNAMEVYYLANGAYTSNIQDLDVSMDYVSSTQSNNKACQGTEPYCYYITDWGYCEIEQRGQVLCMVKKGNNKLAYLRFLSHSTTPWSGKIYCRTQTNATANDTTYKICQAETGSQNPVATWPEDPSFLYQ